MKHIVERHLRDLKSHWILKEYHRFIERSVPSPILSSAAFSSSSPDMPEVGVLDYLQNLEMIRARSNYKIDITKDPVAKLD